MTWRASSASPRTLTKNMVFNFSTRHYRKARMLRTYLSESAIALYLDRYARLNHRYDRTDLEAGRCRLIR